MSFRFRRGRGPVTWAFAPRGNDGAQLNFKKITNIAELSERYGSSVAITIEVDTGAQGGGGPVLFHPNPTISDIQDSAGTVSGFTQETTLTLSGTCVQDGTVELFDGGVSLGQAIVGGSSWTITVSNLSYSSHTFYVVSTASDTTTKQSTDSIVLVDEPMVAPVISQIQTVNETVYATGQTISAPDLTISGTGQIGAAVELISGVTTLWSGTVDGTGNWSTTFTGLSDGSVNTVFARTTDAYESVDSSAWTFTVSLLTFEITNITYDTTTVLNNGTVDSQKDFDVNGTASPNTGITLYSGVDTIGTTTSDANGNWKVTLKSYQVPANTYTLKANDGAVDTANFAFTMDTIYGVNETILKHPSWIRTTGNSDLNTTTGIYDSRNSTNTTAGRYSLPDDADKYDINYGDLSISWDGEFAAFIDYNAILWKASVDSAGNGGGWYTYVRGSRITPASTPSNTEQALMVQWASDVNYDGVKDYFDNTYFNMIYPDHYALANPNQLYNYLITFDSSTYTVRYYIDGVLLFDHIANANEWPDDKLDGLLLNTQGTSRSLALLKNMYIVKDVLVPQDIIDHGMSDRLVPTYNAGPNAYYPLLQASLYPVGSATYYSNLTWDSVNGTATNTGTDETACWQAADSIAYETEIDKYLTVRYDMNFTAFTDHNVMLSKQQETIKDGWLISYAHAFNALRIVTSSDGYGDDGTPDGSINSASNAVIDFAWSPSLNTDYTIHVVFDAVNDNVEVFIDGVSFGVKSFPANNISASITPLDILGIHKTSTSYMGRTAQGTMSNLRFEPVKMTAGDVAIDQ